MPARSEREVKTGLQTRDLPCGYPSPFPVYVPQTDADPVDRDGCRVVKKRKPSRRNSRKLFRALVDWVRVLVRGRGMVGCGELGERLRKSGGRERRTI
jgi:hypothetical protein